MILTRKITPILAWSYLAKTTQYLYITNMALLSTFITTTMTTVMVVAASFLLLLRHLPSSYAIDLDVDRVAASNPDHDFLEFPLNLEYLEAEFFLYGAMGFGLDSIDPILTGGGPAPIGAKQAKLSPLIKDVISQFAFQEVGHLRAIKNTVPGFPRPLLNLSAEAFANVVNNAFGKPLVPSFDPYANDINYLLASYCIPYVGLTGYVGMNPNLQEPSSRKLVAGLLGVESGQDAVLRALLYKSATLKVEPYGISVQEFTNRISELRNKLGRDGSKDEGLFVEPGRGAEGRVSGNVLAGDKFSLAYGRTPEEILRIVYGSGDEGVPGGFYPKGGDGSIVKSHLKHA